VTTEVSTRGVIWDCDGTVVDSEPIAIGIWNELLSELGCDPTDDDWELLVGRPFEAFHEHFSQRCELPPAADLIEEYVARLFPVFRSQLRAFDDAVRAIDLLAERDVPMAIATSSHRERLDFMLGVVGLTDRFAATVAGNEVAAGKPAPEIYEAAAALLQVEPGNCLAVEDTVPGIRAAAAAGMRVVGVARGARLAQELVGADAVVAELDGTHLWSLIKDNDRRDRHDGS
jgi:beta-phosphoglucomutase-like phosphatase (HAD superfamily)